jgi:hypothetical protein
MFFLKRMGSAYRGITARDWALLSLETFCLVAGILIAFELNEWAAARSDASKHDRLMERLFEETGNDVSFIRSMRDLLTENLEHEKQLAVGLARGQCPPDMDFQALRTINRYPAISAPTSVYQELMGAGGLSSIDRRDVRDSLALFHTNLGWTEKQIDFFRSVKVDPVADDDVRMRVHLDPAAPDDPGKVTYDRSALCSDRGFQNRVAFAARNHMVFTSYFEETLKDAINMCVILGDSLGRPCEPKWGGPLKGEDAKFAAEVVAKLRKESAAD